MTFLPQLAVDWRRDKITRRDFPLFQQPKVDGVRGLKRPGHFFSGRSLKLFKNKRLTEYWSSAEFAGLDGELVAPDLEWTDPALCRTTTSVVNTIASKVVPDLIAFDYLDTDTIELPYEKRYSRLQLRVANIDDPHLHVMPFYIVRNMDEIEELDSRFLSQNYEGSILRRPGGMFKPGRSGNGLELWRIKRFIDFEFIIDELIEAKENRNEAKVNELGKTERSSHKANKVGKGMIGMLRGRIYKDIVWNGKRLFSKGDVVDVSAGCLTHAERIAGWKQPSLYVGKIGKAKMFPYGVLDKPRIPVFLSLRAKEDM